MSGLITPSAKTEHLTCTSLRSCGFCTTTTSSIANVGCSFSHPKGSKWRISAINFWLKSCNFAYASIVTFCLRSSGVNCSFTNAFNRSFICGNISFFNERPAACEWPPNWSKNSLQSCNASNILNAPMERHDPLRIPSFVSCKRMAGLP